MPGRTGFLLAEDQAIKERLTGITVVDDKNVARPVQVFFRYPEGEREREYPFITIEMLDIVHARQRQHSDQLLYGFVGNANGFPAGFVTQFNQLPNSITYWPDKTTNLNTLETSPNDVFVRAEEHVPVDLLYQISTYCRSVFHDRQLTSKFLTELFPFRRGHLDIAADGTRRNVFLLDWINADLLDQEAGYRKRMYRKVYTIQMSAELPSSVLQGVRAVDEAVLSFTDKNTNDPL